MQFAKIFDIAGTQLLCVLQPSEGDGSPMLQLTTYVGEACVTIGNRLVEPGEQIDDPAALMARARSLFDDFGQAEAEDAYRLAQRMTTEATRRRERDADGTEDAEDAEPADVLGASDLEAVDAGSDDAASRADPAARPALRRDRDFGVPVMSTALH